MRILVVGGAGYLGSHVVRSCLRQGHEPVVFDNYSTGHRMAVKGVPQLDGDLLDPDSLRLALQGGGFGAVFHHAAAGRPAGAGLRLSQHPDVVGCRNLLDAMRNAGVPRMVFTSSAAVYRHGAGALVDESSPTNPTSPRGCVCLQIESMLRYEEACFDLSYVALRRFCTAGADSLGDIGEDHRPETHFLSRLLLVAQGQLPACAIFGTEYATPDGSCVRDFAHVSDVARAHVLALDALPRCRGESINIGSGVGHSLREVARTVSRHGWREVALLDAPARAGDPALLVANIHKARELLDWQPALSDLSTLISSAWRWHEAHPNGFDRMPALECR